MKGLEYFGVEDKPWNVSAFVEFPLQGFGSLGLEAWDVGWSVAGSKGLVMIGSLGLWGSEVKGPWAIGCKRAGTVRLLDLDLHFEVLAFHRILLCRVDSGSVIKVWDRCQGPRQRPTLNRKIEN